MESITEQLLLDEDDLTVAVQKFIEFIRFETISNSACLDGSYNACANWLLREMQGIGIDSFILPESLPNKPIVVGVWKGSQLGIPGILLNSHYDVVPVMPECWTVPAFEGLVKNDYIYGRGTQDMKCVCIQYLVAIKKLKRIGFQPSRSIFLSFLPDEEIGGMDGMNVMMKSDWFESISIDIALDEGLASTDENFAVFYGERLPWWVKVKATGNTGHASRFIEMTAVEQLIGYSNKVLQYRQQQKDILHNGNSAHESCSHAVAAKKTLGDVTSMNITALRAGIQAAGEDVLNVIPGYAEAGIDIRISPHVDPATVSDMLDIWCEEVSTDTKSSSMMTTRSGGNDRSLTNKNHRITWEFVKKNAMKEHAVTSIDPSKNVWYGLLATVLQKDFNAGMVPQVFPAATDSRFLRAMGMKALGFSPMRRSHVLLHEHDECISTAVFAEGCAVYVKVLFAFASHI
jgi:aminoacylase